MNFITANLIIGGALLYTLRTTRSLSVEKITNYNNCRSNSKSTVGEHARQANNLKLPPPVAQLKMLQQNTMGEKRGSSVFPSKVWLEKDKAPVPPCPAESHFHIVFSSANGNEKLLHKWKNFAINFMKALSVGGATGQYNVHVALRASLNSYKVAMADYRESENTIEEAIKNFFRKLPAGTQRQDFSNILSRLTVLLSSGAGGKYVIWLADGDNGANHNIKDAKIEVNKLDSRISKKYVVMMTESVASSDFLSKVFLKHTGQGDPENLVPYNNSVAIQVQELKAKICSSPKVTTSSTTRETTASQATAPSASSQATVPSASSQATVTSASSQAIAPSASSQATAPSTSSQVSATEPVASNIDKKKKEVTNKEGNRQARLQYPKKVKYEKQQEKSAVWPAYAAGAVGILSAAALFGGYLYWRKTKLSRPGVFQKGALRYSDDHALIGPDILPGDELILKEESIEPQASDYL